MDNIYWARQDLIDRAMDFDWDRSQDEVEIKLKELERALSYFDLNVTSIYINKNGDYETI